jgi:hypothetical protein
MKAKQFQDIRKYLNFQIEMYLKLVVPHKKFPPRIREVFIEHLVCVIEGMGINSNECIEAVRDRLGFHESNDVWQYRSRLKNAGWFIKIYGDKRDKKGYYKLIPNFNFAEKDLKLSLHYNFKIEFTGKIDKYDPGKEVEQKN